MRAVLGLDVDQGGFIDAIEAADDDRFCLHLDELDDGRGNRVRTDRRAEGESPGSLSVRTRALANEIAPGEMHPVEDLQMLVAIEVSECRREGLGDLEPA